jgi:hypothetical protein
MAASEGVSVRVCLARGNVLERYGGESFEVRATRRAKASRQCYGGAKPTSVFTLPFLSLPRRVSPSHSHIGVPAALRTPHSLTNPVGGADVADPTLTLLVPDP